MKHLPCISIPGTPAASLQPGAAANTWRASPPLRAPTRWQSPLEKLSSRFLSTHPPTTTSSRVAKELSGKHPRPPPPAGDALGRPGLYLRLARVAVGLDEDGPDADVLADRSQRRLHGLARSQDRHPRDLEDTARGNGKARCGRCATPQDGTGLPQLGTVAGNPKAHPFKRVVPLSVH